MGINPTSYKMIMEATDQLSKPMCMVLLGSQYVRPKMRQVLNIGFKNAKRHFEQMDIFADVVCIDTNGKFECMKKDLSKPIKDMHGAFDLLYNGGTLEHVVKQQEGWKNVHYLLRPGGIAVHVCPLSGGWPEHSKFLYEQEFFEKLITANDYELIAGHVFQHKKGSAYYLSYKKQKESVFYWKQAEPFLVEQ